MTVRNAPALRTLALALTTAFVAGACDDDDPDGPVVPTNFQVTIENVSAEYDLISSGAFDTPVEDTAAGPIASGMSYEATFSAGVGDRLHFATMFVQSNDLFYAPDENGIALYDGSGNPVSGDVTSQVALWDAATEGDQEPGVGADQAPRQAGPNTGAADTVNTVRLADNNFGNLPTVASAIRVTVTSLGDHQFTLRIDNIASDMSTSGGAVPVLLAPGVFAVGSGSGVLFTPGMPDPGDGLEALAEDGDVSGLSAALAGRTGVTTPIAPGVWAVHDVSGVLFSSGSPDAGLGLEALAEDGDPSALAAALASVSGVQSSGVFNTPDGASAPGVVAPGGSYSFTVSGVPGDRLSFATMFVQSNDLFYAPAEGGITLFSGSTPTAGDVTSLVLLWDAGTEVNEEPGVGSTQAPRQGEPNSGADESGNVQQVDDGFTYPSPVLRVIITPAT